MSRLNTIGPVLFFTLVAFWVTCPAQAPSFAVAWQGSLENMPYDVLHG